MFGLYFLPNWLTSLFPGLKPKDRYQRDFFNYDPLPPPRLRPNRLPITRPSSPESAASSLDLVSNPQPQSLLLELLPLEIRQQIWSNVLAGHTIHLEIVGARLGCLHCVSADPSTCNDGQCVRDISPLAVPENAGKLLSLLKTCRKVYTEAIDILYSSNTFAISEPAVMEYLPRAILSQRINTIRKLRFFWQLPYIPPIHLPGLTRIGMEIQLKRQKKWRKIWHIISTMAGLRELHIKLNVTIEWARLNREAAADLLEPIKQVTKPEIFLLSLPVPALYEGMPPLTRPWSWVARDGWESSDAWDDLPNCMIRRVETFKEL